MKGEQADYIIPLEKAFSFPPKKRITKVVAIISKFVAKHTRYNKTALANEVNHYIHKHSKNIPHYVNATLLKDGARIMVFLQGGKELEAYKKQKDAEKKKKETKKDEKVSKEDKAAAEEKKQKLEDKKEKEEAAAAADMKRK